MKKIIKVIAAALFMTGCSSAPVNNTEPSLQTEQPQQSTLADTLDKKLNYKDFTMYYDSTWEVGETEDKAVQLVYAEGDKTIAVMAVQNLNIVATETQIKNERSGFANTENAAVQGDRGLSFTFTEKTDEEAYTFEGVTIPTNADTYQIAVAVAKDNEAYNAHEYLQAVLGKITIDPNYKPAQATPAASENKNDLKYEITDIYENIYDNPYVGKMYDVVIEVTNTGNAPLYLDKCTLDYEDNDGHLLQTTSDFSISKAPAVIQPGEKGYFYTNGSTSFDPDVSFDNGVKLVPQLKLVKATGELKSYEVTDTTVYNNGYGGVGVKGRIINDTDKEVSLLYITTVYYNAEGHVIGVSYSSVTDVQPNSKTSFDDSGTLNTQMSLDMVADYKVYAAEMYLQF